MSRTACLGLFVVAGCGGHAPPPSTPSTPTSAPTSSPASAAALPTLATTYKLDALPLPGATADGVGMDYLLYDAHTRSVWVPAGNTGAVDVIDVATRTIRQVTGFPTREAERNGKKRVVGPSAAALGEGVVYIGNRGDSSVCIVDEHTLIKGACAPIEGGPDGLAYVASTHELWVTAPRDHALRILDGATLAAKGTVTLPGGPEGFAVDVTRGRFYTNLEDQDVTLAIDLVSHQTVATWKTGCGEAGPRGLRLAESGGLLFVACTARVETLDVAHDGAVVGTLATGDGVDDFDYSPARHALFVGAARAATLTIAAVTTTGTLTAVAVVPTSPGARNGVVDDDGRVYLAHGQPGEIVIATPQ